MPWDGSTENNKVLVYNTLNEQWESIDSYPSTMFIDEFFIQSYGNQRRLFAGCRIWAGILKWPYENRLLASGIVLMDEVVEYDNFVLKEAGGANVVIDPKYISASIISREYTFDSLSEKRFIRAQVQTGNSAGNRVQIIARTYDPDSEETVMDYTFQIGDHTTLRPRIASRGSAIDLKIQIMSGTPAIRAMEVTAISTDRQMVTQE